jgi:hypothetical protein
MLKASRSATQLQISRLSQPAQRRNTMIDLYFWPTPNGKKITILLEEADIPYNIKPINIGRGDQLNLKARIICC